jgi:NAD(P)-dependent dehydrogenase (short-subunit alcohol dehydrogenase family)
MLDGLSAIVTGSSSGIGLAIAQARAGSTPRSRTHFSLRRFS